MPSDLPSSAEAEARKWRAYAAAEESAHAIVSVKLGFVPPDNLRLSIDPATPGFLGSGSNTAAQHLGWHHLVRMWFDIQNAGCPTTAGRIAALEAVAMIAQAGPLAAILMDPDAPDLTDRGWVLDGLNVLYTGTESGWETGPNDVAMLALAERTGLRGRPAFAEVPDGVDEAAAEEARGEKIVDDYVALLAKTRALLTAPDVSAAHARLAADLQPRGTLPFQRVYEIMSLR